MSRNLRLLLGLLVAAVAVSAILLGRWQLRRLSARLALNSAMTAAATLPPIDLNHESALEGSVAGRRIVARGIFDPRRHILIRGRVQDQAPGLEVVTPLLLEGTADRAVWVVRGFVRSPDAATPPAMIPSADTGVVEVTGLAVEVLARGDSGKPLARGSDTTWSRLDLGPMRAIVPGTLPFALQLAGDSTGPGRLPTVPPLPLTNGPHLSYAIQWFGIALAAIVFGIIFLRRGGPGSVQPREAP